MFLRRFDLSELFEGEPRVHLARFADLLLFVEEVVRYIRSEIQEPLGIAARSFALSAPADGKDTRYAKTFE